MPEATAEATAEPTAEPTADPAAEATAEPTAEPTESPDATPTLEPASSPTPEPSQSPSDETAPDPGTANRAPYFPSGSHRTENLGPGEWPAEPDAVDPDGDTLTYSVVDGVLPDGLTLDAAGTWSGDVAGAVGSFAVTIEACDPYGACASQVLSLVYESVIVGDGAVLDESASLPDTSMATPLDTDSRPADVWLLVAALLASASSLALASGRIRLRGAAAK